MNPNLQQNEQKNVAWQFCPRIKHLRIGAGQRGSESLCGKECPRFRESKGCLAANASQCDASDCPARAAAHCELRNTDGFWELAFNGESAVLRQAQGLFYLAFLLANAGGTPIEAQALAAAVHGEFSEHPDFQSAIADHGSSGAAQEAELLKRKEAALEAILDSPDELEPVKAEVARELARLSNEQDNCRADLASAADRMAMALFEQLREAHNGLANGVDARGEPHPVIRAFSRHVLLRVLVPSLRLRSCSGVAVFVYEGAES